MYIEPENNFAMILSSFQSGGFVARVSMYYVRSSRYGSRDEIRCGMCDCQCEGGRKEKWYP